MTHPPEEARTVSDGDDTEEISLFIEKSRSKLRELEDIRLKKLGVFEFRKKIAKPISAILTPILGFVDYWLLFLQQNDDNSGAGVTVLGLLGLWGWVRQPKRQYARAYKAEILPDIACLFGDFQYEAEGKIPIEEMKPSKIVPRHSTYRSEDFFAGEHKNVGIKFSEIELLKQSGKRQVTVFKGLAILLTHGTKKFHGHTILTKDQGKIGEWLKKQIGNLERVDLVDPVFEDLFDVYTNDQVEARYLIDPRIVENLKALFREYSGDKMMTAFFDDRFLILIASHTNHFEPASIETPATSERSIVSMKREITEILAIVDRLSLYDWRKR